MLLEKLEDKMGEVVVSASKAQKIKVGINWLAYENKEPIMVRLHLNVKVDVLLNILKQDL